MNQPDQRFKNNNQSRPLETAPATANPKPGPAGTKDDPAILTRLRRSRRRKKQQRKKLLMSAAALFLVLILFFFSPLFKVKRVTIRGVYNGDLTTVEEKAREQVGDHVLFYGKNEIIAALTKDPYVESVEVSAKINGDMEIQIHEYAADYALLRNGTVYTLNRTGRVLGTGYTTPTGVTELTDDTPVLAPGNIMYGDGPKKTVMSSFRKLMEENTSSIQFQKLDIKNPALITLAYNDWTVELGSFENFQAKLNTAINILKSVTPDDAPGIIDLKFDAPPVIRPKGGA